MFTHVPPVTLDNDGWGWIRHFSDHELGLTCAIWGGFAPRNLATRLSFNRLNLQEAGPSQLALWPWSSSTHKANTQMITSHDAPNKKSSTTLPQFIYIIEDRLIQTSTLSLRYILYWFDWLPGMPLWNLRLSPERQVREVRGDAESHLTYPRARDKARHNVPSQGFGAAQQHWRNQNAEWHHGTLYIIWHS